MRPDSGSAKEAQAREGCCAYGAANSSSYIRLALTLRLRSGQRTGLTSGAPPALAGARYIVSLLNDPMRFARLTARRIGLRIARRNGGCCAHIAGCCGPEFLPGWFACEDFAKERGGRAGTIRDAASGREWTPIGRWAFTEGAGGYQPVGARLHGSLLQCRRRRERRRGARVA